SLWELNKMIQKATERSPLLYCSFYGCYCGLGGWGQPHTRRTGKCCQTHDSCYSSLLNSGC
ncbi:PA2 phospholipase, partial [Rhinopomastus cyanomelas]|nr:PA2 phospholipase [Rhinopomastus cyanomelas]